MATFRWRRSFFKATIHFGGWRSTKKGDERRVKGEFSMSLSHLVLNEKLGHSIERYTKGLAMIKLPFNWNPFFVLTFFFFFFRSFFQECLTKTRVSNDLSTERRRHDRFALFNIGCRANLPFVSIQRSRFSSVRFKWNFGWLAMFGDLD